MKSGGYFYLRYKSGALFPKGAEPKMTSGFQKAILNHIEPLNSY